MRIALGWRGLRRRVPALRFREVIHMDKGIFTDREKAMEANYFRQQDAKLLEKLRKGAKLDEIARRAGGKAEGRQSRPACPHPGVWGDRRQYPGVLRGAVGAGRLGGGQGFEARGQTVLRLARERGIEEASPAYAASCRVAGGPAGGCPVRHGHRGDQAGFLGPSAEGARGSNQAAGRRLPQGCGSVGERVRQAARTGRRSFAGRGIGARQIHRKLRGSA